MIEKIRPTWWSKEEKLVLLKWIVPLLDEHTAYITGKETLLSILSAWRLVLSDQPLIWSLQQGTLNGFVI